MSTIGLCAWTAFNDGRLLAKRAASDAKIARKAWSELTRTRRHYFAPQPYRMHQRLLRVPTRLGSFPLLRHEPFQWPVKRSSS